MDFPGFSRYKADAMLTGADGEKIHAVVQIGNIDIGNA
jgi:hypothetical protein